MQPNARALKILIVMPLAEQRGGGELMLLHLVEHARRLEVAWTIVFFEDGPMVNAVRAWGAEVTVLPAGRLREPHHIGTTIWKLRRLIITLEPDLVFSWMVKAQLYAGAAAALAKTPAAWYQLGLPDPPNWHDRVATALPAIGILTCSNVATAAQRRLHPRRQTRTVNPAVDLSRFDPSALPTPQDCRRQLGLPTDGPLIGIVGRLQRWKGMHYLVDAMPGVLEKYPGAHAVIVGGDHAFEPDYPAFLRGRIAALNLQQRVILTGLQANVPQWMQAMNVIVHASDAEPFGIVVIEAMALGKPVAATNTAGPTEIITPAVDGLLWKRGEPQQLSAAILRFLDRPDDARAMGQRARMRASAFSTDIFARNVVRELRGFLAASGSH